MKPVSFQRILVHQEDNALLKAYIGEWRKFVTQADYLPKPFLQLESNLHQGKSPTMQHKSYGAGPGTRPGGHSQQKSAEDGYVLYYLEQDHSFNGSSDRK